MYITIYVYINIRDSENNMKSRLNISGESLSIKTPIQSFLLAELFGIVLFITGLYNPGSISYIDHLLIGLGIIFISLGLFYISNSRYYKMVVNNETGELSIFESNSWDISPFKIPADYFSGILVQLIVNKKNKIEYDVLLKNRPGSFIMLARFPDRKRAVLFGEKLQKMLKIELKINDTEIPPVFPKVKEFVPIELSLSGNTSILLTDRPHSIGISWKTTHHPFQFFFILAIYYGLFHIIHFSAVGLLNPSLPFIIIIYTSMGLVFPLFVVWIIDSLIARNFFIIYRDGVRAYRKSFGRKKKEVFIYKKDIVMTRNSMDLGNELFAVGSSKWAEASNRMVADKERGIEGRVHIPPGSILRVDTSRLRLIEKLFIEQYILKYL